MYQGATPQTPQQQMQGPTFTPRVQPMGGMLEAAVQAGFGVVEQYAELKDFGASQQAEHQRRINDQQMREEFESKMRLPWGAEGGFYDSEGNRKDDEVSAFVNRWQEENNKIPRPFWLAKNAMRDEGDLMQANDALASRVGLMTLDAEAKNWKQAFLDNYNLAVKQKDWNGARRVIDRAVEAGQITRSRGDEMRLEVDKTSFSLQFADLSATNPDLAAEMINRGELDGLFSAAEQEQMMRSLRRQDDSRLTELIEQAVSQPRGKDNRQAMASALLAGDPYEDELKFLSVYNRDQSFAACMPEIENFLHRLADDVAPGEEKNALERKMTDLSRKCTFYQMPSDTKSRLLKRMEENAKRRAEYPKLNAVDYIRNETAGRNVKLYDPVLYNERIGSLNQAANSTYALVKESYKNAGFSVPDRAKWGEKYAKDSINALQDELTNQTISKVRVAFDSWHNAYKQDHGDKEPSITIQEDKLETLLRQYTGNQNFALPGKFGKEADKAVKEANRATENAYLQSKKSAPKLADDQAKERFISQKSFTFPATVSVDTVQTNAPAGILLPESMKKRFGDDLSHVAALVPVSSSSRRGRPLPIVGYTKAASPQLTLAGASKLRMTFSSRMNTHVTVIPAGKEIQEFFKREFFNQPSGDSEAPPLDYGLVPDNDVETAEPVSGAYLNGDLTMLPPLN